MRRHYRRMLVAIIVAVTAVASVLAGAFASATVSQPPRATVALAPPVAPYTAFSLDGHGGSPLDYGSHGYDQVTVSSVGENLNVTGKYAASPNTGDAHLSLEPPDGQTWVAGTTYTIGRAFQDVADAYFSIGVGNNGCNQTNGTLTVLEVARTGPNVSTFAASFAMACEAFTPTVTGEIRWNSTIGWQAAAFTPVLSFGRYSFSGVVSGTTSAPLVRTFVGRGSQPLTFGEAVIEGPDAGLFAIDTDTCSGVTLAFDETCDVGVVATPTSAGSKDAYLRIPDDSAFGYKYLWLNATVSPAPVTTTSTTTTTTAPPTTTPPAPTWVNDGTYYALTPERLLDTRVGNGAPKAKLGAGATLNLDVAGRGGVPESGASAVVLNVTATSPTASSYLTVYPQGVTRPTASSLNFNAGWTGANMVTVGLGDTGGVSIFNNVGTVDVIADVVGYYAADGSMVSTAGQGSFYAPGVPERFFDSRVDWGARLPAGEAAIVPFTVGDTAADQSVRAVAVNVTAVDPVGSGYFTTWDGAEAPPLASTLNFTKGAVVPNMAVVPVSWCMECDGSANPVGFPAIGVYTSVDAHVIVDVQGVFYEGEDGLRFEPVTPERIADSRLGQGLPGKLGTQASGTIGMEFNGDTSTVGLALNVTAVDPTSASYVSVWPTGYERPLVSNLNTVKGQTVPNSVYTMLGLVNYDSGTDVLTLGFDVYNNQGSVHLVADVVGTFYFLDTVPAGVRAGVVAGQSELPQVQADSDALRPALRGFGHNGLAVR